MEDSELVDDDWYCNICSSTRFPTRIAEHSGPFGQFELALEKSNQKAFSLPSRVQTYFEGVKKGQEGVYEEVATSKPPK